MKDHINVHVAPGASTIEPSGATDDIRYVLNRKPSEPQSGTAGGTAGGTSVSADPGTDASGTAPAGAGGLADAVIDNADGQLPDQTESTIRGGKVGQESKRGAY